MRRKSIRMTISEVSQVNDKEGTSYVGCLDEMNNFYLMCLMKFIEQNDFSFSEELWLLLDMY